MMLEIRFVRYDPTYLDDILNLHRSAISGLSIGIDAVEEERDLIDVDAAYFARGGEFLVGLIDDRVVAMRGIKIVGEDEAELKRMRVDVGLQGQGIGGLLLRELERCAVECGVRRLILETAKARPLTLEFYRKHGYVAAGSGRYGEVETVRFAKSLI